MNLELKNCLPAKASGKGLLKPSLVCKDVSSHASRQPVLSVHLVAILSIIFPPLSAPAPLRENIHSDPSKTNLHDQERKPMLLG